MQYVIQTLQKGMITRIKNRWPNASSQGSKLFIRFQSHRKQKQEYFLQNEYRQREIKIIFDTNRLPK